MNNKLLSIFQKIQDDLSIHDFDLKHIASRPKFVSDFLSRFPSKVNISSFYSQNTLLHFCSHYDSALSLLDAGASVDAKNRLFQTPLLVCPTSDVANLLIERGAIIKARDHLGRNQLHFCNDVNKIEYFISIGVYANSKDFDGRTPLFFSNTLSVVQLLLSKKCNLRIRDKYYNTPLFYLHNPDVLQFLIDNDLSVNATNSYRQNALFVNTSFSAIFVLLRNNINVNQVDTYNRKAFYYNPTLCQIYHSNINDLSDSLYDQLDFSQYQLDLAERNNKFNYFYDHNTCCYTLKKFDFSTTQMNPDFNDFYLNNNIPAYFSSSSQQPQSNSFIPPPPSSIATTSDYNWNNFDTDQLERVQPGGRYLWNDHLLEQAAQYMYNNNRNNGLKRTAQKFNVIKNDLQNYYNEYISRMDDHSSNFSDQSFHIYISDDVSIYPSDDDDFIQSINAQLQPPQNTLSQNVS